MAEAFYITWSMTTGKRIRLRVRAANDNRTEESERAECERVAALVVQLWVMFARMEFRQVRG